MPPSIPKLAVIVALAGIGSARSDTAGSAGDARARFLALIDRPRVPAAAEAAPMRAPPGLAEYHFSFASEARERVPGVLIKSSALPGRLPVVILLHGTGGNKEGMIPLARRLARRGFLAVAIDGRYHGERCRAGSGTVDYNAAIVRAWRGSGEHPFYYDTVWDVMRLIDYLDTRGDVEPAHIGLVGFSKGGIETYLAAAVDTRIAVAVPCIGVESFRWALDHDRWQPRIATIQPAFDAIVGEAGGAKDTAMVRRFYDRVVPGIYGIFDGPAMLPLIAPRPLLTINGETDAKTPPESLKECTDAAAAAYRRLGAEDHFAVCIEKGTGHHVTPDAAEQALDWLSLWLCPPEPWPSAVVKVEIPCSDGARQGARWYAPPGSRRRPLLVALHTWGSNFDDPPEAEYAKWCLKEGWIFLHPDFRGPNQTPPACGSDRAVEDVVEAVAWAQRRTAVDDSRIYLIGVSGGGHMALQLAGRHPGIWAGVSAWCGISDLAAFYADMTLRQEWWRDHYLQNTEAVLGGPPFGSSSRRAEAWKRSPVSSLRAAASVPLDINDGLRDPGVNFTQGLIAFNATVPPADRLEEKAIASFRATGRLPVGWPRAGRDASYGRRQPIFRRISGNTRVTIFDGAHEIILQAGLNWLARQRKGRPAVWVVNDFVPVAVDAEAAAK